MGNTATTKFDLSIFNNYNDLHDFFQKSDAVTKVLTNKNAPPKNLAPSNPNLSGKWFVAQITTAPFRILFAIILKCIQAIASTLGAKGFAKQMKHYSLVQLEGFTYYSTEPTKLFKIKTSVNTTNAEGKIFKQMPLLPASGLPDEVKKHTFASIYSGIKFERVNEGVCKGMSGWFIYLYLKTKNQFSDPRAQMRAIGKEFKNGAGIEASLLQVLYLGKGKLLDLTIETQWQFNDHPHFNFSGKDWNTSPEATIERLKIIPAGVYHLSLPGHSTAFVKVNDHLSYFFDPNFGITEINGVDVEKQLYALILKSVATIEDRPGQFNSVPFYVTLAPCRSK